jgi:hypothetical protein
VLEDRFGQDVVQSGIRVSVVMGLWFPRHEGNIYMKEYLAHLIQSFLVDCAVLINILLYTGASQRLYRKYFLSRTSNVPKIA